MCEHFLNAWNTKHTEVSPIKRGNQVTNHLIEEYNDRIDIRIQSLQNMIFVMAINVRWALKGGPCLQKYPGQECIPVGCVPPTCWPYPSMHCGREGYLPRRVYYLPRGCTCPGGYLPGGVPAWGCVPAQVLPPVDRQTPVKTTFANIVCGR